MYKLAVIENSSSARQRQRRCAIAMHITIK